MREEKGIDYILNKRNIGSRYEQRAAQYLEEQGYQILERNYRCRLGEIDLVARDGNYLVFVEVKYRMDERAGYGLESVDVKKQRRIVRAASWYLCEKHIREGQPCRFDVVSFFGEELTLIKDAFQT